MAVKEKYTLEYIMRTSERALVNCLSTPSGLSEWFADDVNVKKDVYTFVWDGSEESAKLVHLRNNSIRFQWLNDEGTQCYFEFSYRVDPLTQDIVFFVTDHAEADEIEESKLLWDSQVNELRKKLGA
ncbi:MAG: START-like domain-containing protein [Flavobacteriales bacterium]